MDPNFEFFIYAFPALGSCQQVNDKERSRLEGMVLGGKAPSTEELSKLYPDAFRRMKEKLGASFWTLENIQTYWWIEHNEIIDNKEAGYEYATDAHREVCKVKFWEVISANQVIADLRNKEGTMIKALNYRHLDLKPGYYVVTHKKSIAKKINRIDYEKYG